MTDPRTPLTDEEIHEMLSMTMHGPPPTKTIYRMMATLYVYVELKKEIKKLMRTLDECEEHASFDSLTEIMMSLEKHIK